MKLFGFLLLIPALYSLPQGCFVEAGSASAKTQGNLMQVHTSNRAVINWSDFSIRQGEILRFLQPDANSTVLNRVWGGNASEILGSLQANGRVLLLNPNGICIGKDALIDTAGFVASTLRLDTYMFLHDRELIFSGDSMGKIKNLGRIQAPGGEVLLIAREVINEGTIAAQRIELVSGQNVVVLPEENAFTISKLEKSGVQGFAINHKGVIQADTVSTEGGKVFLRAPGAMVEVSGSIQAPKGVVHVLGDKVFLIDNAKIDVSHEVEGGTILVGGDRGGKNPEIPNARYVWTGSNTELLADGGGKVILWGDIATQHWGKISIRGTSGDGGFAEVSAPHLTYRGIVDGRAPFGKKGTLLLDPNDVEINGAATSGAWSGCGLPPNEYLFNDPTATNQILNTDLEAQLVLCDVEIDTNSSGGVGPNNGSISVLSPVDWSATGSQLSLIANTDVTIAAQMDAGSGGLLISSGNDVTLSADLVAGDGDVDISATNDFLLTAPVSLSTNNGEITFHSGMDIDVQNTLTLTSTGSGSVEFNAMGSVDFQGIVTANDTDFTVLAVNDVTVGAPFSTNDGNIWLQPDGVANLQDTMTSNGGNITVIAENDVVLSANLLTVSGDIHIQSDFSSIQMTVPVILTTTDGDFDFLSDIDIDVQDTLNLISMGTGEVLLDASGNIALQNTVTANNTDFTVLANGQITLSGDINTTAGDVGISAGGNVSFAAPIAMAGDTGDFTIRSGGAINIPNTLTLNTTGNSVADFRSRGNFTVGNTLSINDVDTFFFARNGNFLLGANVNTNDGDMILRGGAGFVLTSGVAATMTGGGFIAFQSNQNLSVQNALNISGPGGNEFDLDAFGSILVNAPISNNNPDLLLIGDGDIQVNSSISSVNGNLLLMAGVNIQAQNPVTIQTTGAGTLTLVADNEYANPPKVGLGVISLAPTSVISTAGSDLRLYSSVPSLTILPTTMNGFAVPGTFSAVGVYYPDGVGGVPFAIFYKALVSDAMQNAINSENAAMNQSLEPSSPDATDTIQSMNGLPATNPSPCQGS